MLAGVVLHDTITGKTRDLDITGLFISIDHDPRTELCIGQIDLETRGTSRPCSVDLYEHPRRLRRR